MGDSTLQIKTLNFRGILTGLGLAQCLFDILSRHFSHIPAALPPLLAGQSASFLPQRFSPKFPHPLPFVLCTV